MEGEKKAVITLYMLRGCPKCEILQKLCRDNPALCQKYEYQEVLIDTDRLSEQDQKAIDFLRQAGISEMPVLLKNDGEFHYLPFGEAVNFVRSFGM